MTTLCSVRKQSKIRVVKRASASGVSDSYLRTPTYPSKIEKKSTDDLFDFVAILFDKFKREKSNCNDSLGFDDDSLVDLSE